MSLGSVWVWCPVFGSGADPKRDSTGNVYVSSQSRSVDEPKRPALRYCGAWMWVSGLICS